MTTLWLGALVVASVLASLAAVVYAVTVPAWRRYREWDALRSYEAFRDAFSHHAGGVRW